MTPRRAAGAPGRRRRWRSSRRRRRGRATSAPVLTEQPEDLTVDRDRGPRVPRSRRRDGLPPAQSLGYPMVMHALTSVSDSAFWSRYSSARCRCSWFAPRCAAVGGRARDRRRHRSRRRAVRGVRGRRRRVAARDRPPANDIRAPRRCRPAPAGGAHAARRVPRPARCGGRRPGRIAAPRIRHGGRRHGLQPGDDCLVGGDLRCDERRGGADAPELMVTGVGIGSLCWVPLLAAGTVAARRAVGIRAMRIVDAMAGMGLIAFGWRSPRPRAESRGRTQRDRRRAPPGGGARSPAGRSWRVRRWRRAGRAACSSGGARPRGRSRARPGPGRACRRRRARRRSSRPRRR